MVYLIAIAAIVVIIVVLSISSKHREKVREEEKRAKAIEDERIAAEKKKEKIAQILKPSCDKGDCLWNGGRFYFTCDDCAECQRKNTTRKDWGDNSQVIPELWTYMKRMEHVLQKQDGLTPHSAEWDVAFNEEEELVDEFISKYLSGVIGTTKTYALHLFKTNLAIYGMTRENPTFDLIWSLKDKGVSLTENMLNVLCKKEIPYSDGDIDLHLDFDFYRNPSLYKRTDEEFDYTVKTMEIIRDENLFSKYFVPESVDIDAMYDSDGNIKPAGLGGPKAGNYGDTIWNVIESWEEVPRE